MNAVNLLPEGRRSGTELRTSRSFLGLVAALLLVLVASVLYWNADDSVRARQSELSQVSAATQRWQVAANSYTRYVQAAQQHEQQIGEVKELAAGRFDWTRLLSQVAGLMPANAALSSLQATTPSAAATGSTSSSGSSGIQISACAASQPAVAQTMVQLRRITGVSTVTLSSSSSGSGSTSTSSSSGSSGACPFPVSFQVSLTFTAAAAQIASTAASSGATGDSTTTTAPSTATTPSNASAGSEVSQ